MSHAIRSAVRSDVAAMLEISNAAALDSHANFAIEPEPLEDWLAEWDTRHRDFPAFVAEVEGEPVGFARSGPWLGRCAYTHSCEVSVYVERDFRGRGIGRALYTALLAEVDGRDFHCAIGGIALPNDASVSLHEAMGFVHVGTFVEVGFKFDRWWNVGYWQRIGRP